MKEVVLEAGGLLQGSSAPALETFLRRHPGIHHAEASYLSDTVTVGYDESAISEAEIRRLIEEWVIIAEARCCHGTSVHRNRAVL